MVYILKRITNESETRLKFAHAFDFIAPHLTRSGAVYTGVTKTDADKLAPKLGLPAVDLYPPSDPYDKSTTGKYWTTFSVKIGNDDIRIDTGTPQGELEYKFLRGHYKVADGAGRKSSRHSFMLVDEEHEASKKISKGKVRAQAYAYFSTMDINEMRSCLRSLGEGGSEKSSNVVEATLSDAINAKPERFVDLWVNNKERAEVAWLVDCTHVGILRKDADGRYFYNKEVIGLSTADAIQWYKDTKNKETVSIINKELAAKKKLK